MIGALRTAADDRWYRLALGALVLSAWLVMAIWGASPYAAWLHHEEGGHEEGGVGHHESHGAGGGIGEGHVSPVSRLILFVFGWTLMTIAMMLPGTLPLLNLFRRVTGMRPDRNPLLVRLGVGYLVTWAVFGAMAYVGDGFVHELVERVTWLGAASWSIPSVILLAAGVYQFTPLKEKCLAECRSPYAFLVGSWHGRDPRREAWQLGLRHGLFCVGCCWTLMLLMFAVGVAHVGWMLTLGAVMSAERAMPWGRRVTRPVGVLLIGWAALQLIAVAAA